MRVLLCSVVSFLTFISYGQVAVSVKAQGGAGVAKITSVNSSGAGFCDCGTTIGAQAQKQSIVGEMAVDIRYKFLQLGIGLQYFTTPGVTNAQYEYFPSGVTHTLPAIDTKESHEHVILPLSIGGRIKVRNTFYLTPEVSIPLAYLSSDDRNGTVHHYTALKLNAEKQLTKRLGIVLTPACYFIETPTTLYYDLGITRSALKETVYSRLFALQVGVSYRVY